MWPVPYVTSLAAYSLTINGRRLDSFIPTGGPDGKPAVLDNGTGYFLPPGTATWNAANDTVTFHVRRDYLADQQIKAPYNVYAVTGLHARTNDWVKTLDVAPDARNLEPGGAEARQGDPRRPEGEEEVTTKTYQAGSGSFTPADSTLGLSGLISAVDNKDYIEHPDRPAVLGPGHAEVGGRRPPRPDRRRRLVAEGRLCRGRRERAAGPRALGTPRPQVVVDPNEVLSPTDYTLTVKRTTVVADKDKDGVPDIADNCKKAKGPSAGGGCPDTDADSLFDKADKCPKVAGDGADGCPTRAGEKVVAYIDGKKVDAESVLTEHGGYAFDPEQQGQPRQAQARAEVARRPQGRQDGQEDHLTGTRRPVAPRGAAGLYIANR